MLGETESINEEDRKIIANDCGWKDGWKQRGEEGLDVSWRRGVEGEREQGIEKESEVG